MQDEKLGNYGISFEEALTRSIEIESLRFDEDHKPDLEGVQTWKLKESTRVTKLAKYWTIRDRHSGQTHHHVLTLETIESTKKHGTVIKDKHRITLNDEDEDEIGLLLDALASISQTGKEGHFIIINLKQKMIDD